MVYNKKKQSTRDIPVISTLSIDNDSQTTSTTTSMKKKKQLLLDNKDRLNNSSIKNKGPKNTSAISWSNLAAVAAVAAAASATVSSSEIKMKHENEDDNNDDIELDLDMENEMEMENNEKDNTSPLENNAVDMEKAGERKRKHAAVEKRRREVLNIRIDEISSLLPLYQPADSSASSLKEHKAEVLARARKYIDYLQQCNNQFEMIRQAAVSEVLMTQDYLLKLRQEAAALSIPTTSSSTTTTTTSTLNVSSTNNLPLSHSATKHLISHSSHSSSSSSSSSSSASSPYSSPVLSPASPPLYSLVDFNHNTNSTNSNNQTEKSTQSLASLVTARVIKKEDQQQQQQQHQQFLSDYDENSKLLEHEQELHSFDYFTMNNDGFYQNGEFDGYTHTTTSSAFPSRPSSPILRTSFSSTFSSSSSSSSSSFASAPSTPLSSNATSKLSNYANNINNININNNNNNTTTTSFINSSNGNTTPLSSSMLLDFKQSSDNKSEQWVLDTLSIDFTSLPSTLLPTPGNDLDYLNSTANEFLLSASAISDSFN